MGMFNGFWIDLSFLVSAEKRNQSGSLSGFSSKDFLNRFRFPISIANFFILVSVSKVWFRASEIKPGGQGRKYAAGKIGRNRKPGIWMSPGRSWRNWKRIGSQVSDWLPRFGLAPFGLAPNVRIGSQGSDWPPKFQIGSSGQNYNNFKTKF